MKAAPNSVGSGSLWKADGEPEVTEAWTSKSLANIPRLGTGTHCSGRNSNTHLVMLEYFSGLSNFVFK